MIYNISYSSILAFGFGIFFVASHFYFKKKKTKGNDGLLLLCGILLLLISLGFHFFK